MMAKKFTGSRLCLGCPDRLCGMKVMVAGKKSRCTACERRYRRGVYHSSYLEQQYEEAMGTDPGGNIHGAMRVLDIMQKMAL